MSQASRRSFETHERLEPKTLESQEQSSPAVSGFRRFQLSGSYSGRFWPGAPGPVKAPLRLPLGPLFLPADGLLKLRGLFPRVLGTTLLNPETLEFKPFGSFSLSSEANETTTLSVLNLSTSDAKPSRRSKPEEALPQRDNLEKLDPKCLKVKPSSLIQPRNGEGRLMGMHISWQDIEVFCTSLEFHVPGPRRPHAFPHSACAREGNAFSRHQGKMLRAEVSPPLDEQKSCPPPDIRRIK